MRAASFAFVAQQGDSDIAEFGDDRYAVNRCGRTEGEAGSHAPHQATPRRAITTMRCRSSPRARTCPCCDHPPPSHVRARYAYGGDQTFRVARSVTDKSIISRALP